MKIRIATRRWACRARDFVANSLSPGRRFTPPRIPTSLPGSLWAVATFFNPAGYLNKIESYRRFRASLARQGVPLLTVELAFGDTAHVLAGSDAERLIQHRTDSVLWHKERLINLGIEALPEDCDKVAWVDADVLFKNDRWASETAKQLEQYVVVQPYEHVVRLPHGQLDCDAGQLNSGYLEGECSSSMASALVGRRFSKSLRYRFSEHGHCGFAWSARRSFLQQHGLYDRHLLGNGDRSIAMAFYGALEGRNPERLNTKAQDHVDAWARRVTCSVRGSVSFTPGLLLHLWHGSHSDRQYDVPLRVLHECSFDPEQDLGLDDVGLLSWTSNKPELHRWCEEYFRARREEG